MMKTMPLPEIIGRLMAINNCSEQFAGTFLAEFTALVAQELAVRNTLVVKGLGTFRCIEIGDELTVEFAPDTALAAAVNAPFAMFDPVELDDGVTMEMLEENQTTSVMTSETNDAGNAETSAESVPESNAHDDTCLQSAPTNVTQADNVSGREIGSQTAAVNVSSTPDTPTRQAASPPPIPPRKAHDTTVIDKKQHVTHEKIIEKERVVEVVGQRHHGLMLALTAIVAMLAGFVIGYFVYEKLNLTNVKSVNISADDVQVYHQVTVPDVTMPDTITANTHEGEQLSQSSDSITAVTSNAVASPAGSTDIDAKSVETVVTDTVRSNRFLTTMAQQYYGKKKFWVYIYEENRDRLDNPDRISANTVVVIPPADKYHIKAGDVESEADAERRASEIISRYSNK